MEKTQKRSYGKDRKTQVVVRVTESEKQDLHDKAVKLGYKTISEMFRKLVAAA